MKTSVLLFVTRLSRRVLTRLMNRQCLEQLKYRSGPSYLKTSLSLEVNLVCTIVH